MDETIIEKYLPMIILFFTGIMVAFMLGMTIVSTIDKKLKTIEIRLPPIENSQPKSCNNKINKKPYF